jgi:hypothetical protein
VEPAVWSGAADALVVRDGVVSRSGLFQQLTQAQRVVQLSALPGSGLTAAPDLDGWTVVERLLEDLAPLQERVWLVIDDLHELCSAEALRQLELFMMRAPATLRFMLVTRHDLRLALHRLRLSASSPRSARMTCGSAARRRWRCWTRPGRRCPTPRWTCCTTGPRAARRLLLRTSILRHKHSHAISTVLIILTRDGWSWADAQGNFDLRAPGLLFRQRRTSTAPVSKRRSLPRGSGSYAVIRALVGSSGGEDSTPGATALAARAGISQPRASQILHQLHDLQLVRISGHGRWEPQREALVDRFLGEYPGPGGSEQYHYTLGSPVDVAVRAGRVSSPARPIAVSADVGPDLIVPWRRPSLVILYARHAIDPAGLGLTDAQGRHDANVIMRNPEDRSVFPMPVLAGQVQGNEVPLADPLQQIWDLQDLGGADRVEAAGRLREWLLERP